MIAYLQGKMIGKTDSYAVVLTGGVGYKVFAAGSVLGKEIGSEVELYIYTQVREDAFNLYGFLTRSELSTFELLISVSGVGPKMALSVLSAGEPSFIQNAIVSQDVSVFTNISGVGRKTAERIIVELKEKMGNLIPSETVSGQRGSAGDLVAALEAFGYSNREIREAITSVDRTAGVEDQLRQALKILGKK